VRAASGGTHSPTVARRQGSARARAFPLAGLSMAAFAAAIGIGRSAPPAHPGHREKLAGPGQGYDFLYTALPVTDRCFGSSGRHHRGDTRMFTCTGCVVTGAETPPTASLPGTAVGVWPLPAAPARSAARGRTVCLTRLA